MQIKSKTWHIFFTKTTPFLANTYIISFETYFNEKKKNAISDFR